MIAFDLKCQAAHVFEAWFGTSAAYDEQQERGLICCPVCGDVHISKAIMAPNIGRKGNQPPAISPVSTSQTDASPPNTAVAKPATKGKTSAVPSVMPGASRTKEQTEKLVAAMEAVREQVEKNCDYVGKEFAEEARKIHYGEADDRGIYGEATIEEAEELFDEGIDIAALPFPAKPDRFDA